MSYFENRDKEQLTQNPDRYDRPGVEDELYSVPVKAGKRIYYFDVKSTRGDDYYVTITESRKRLTRDGGFMIDKHKIHLYKEDFEKFALGLQDVLDYIRLNKPDNFELPISGELSELEPSLTPQVPDEDEFFKGL